MNDSVTMIIVVDVVDADDLLDALDTGTVAGRLLPLCALDGYGFWVHLLYRFIEDPDGSVRHVSLGLPHVVDAPTWPRALESSA